jgi:delta 1-pyrroline-5-carboxylate dehydrogenase
LRHSFVSVLSDAGIPVEQIAQLVGHSGTTVTELVYRHQLRPVIQTGATVMDHLFSRRLRVGVVRQRGEMGQFFGANIALTWVGDTGFEPVTSSV